MVFSKIFEDELFICENTIFFSLEIDLSLSTSEDGTVELALTFTFLS